MFSFVIGTPELASITINTSTAQEQEGEKVDLERINEEGGGDPRSLNLGVSAVIFSDTMTMVITSQESATAYILSQSLQILDTGTVNPDLLPIAYLSTPATPGQYYVLIVTSSFTAYGTFAVN